MTYHLTSVENEVISLILRHQGQSLLHSGFISHLNNSLNASSLLCEVSWCLLELCLSAGLCRQPPGRKNAQERL